MANENDARKIIAGCEKLGRAKTEKKIDEAPTPEHARCVEYALLCMGGLMDYPLAVIMIAESITKIRKARKEKASEATQ